MKETRKDFKIVPLKPSFKYEQVKGRIKEIADRKGLRLKQVAKGAGISPSQLSKINSGISSVTLSQIKLISKALNVSFVELIDLPEGYGYTTDCYGEINGMIDLTTIKTNSKTS